MMIFNKFSIPCENQYNSELFTFEVIFTILIFKVKI